MRTPEKFETTESIQGKNYLSFFRKLADSDLFYIILYFILYGLVILTLFVVLGKEIPLPFKPIDTTPNWASWFDIYITFPVMSLVSLLAFKGSTLRRITFPMALFFPVFLIGYSYLDVYTFTYIPLLYSGYFNTGMILPVALLFLVPAAPLAGSLFLLVSLNHGGKLERRYSGNSFYMVLVVLSFTLAAIEVLMRFLQSTSMYVNLSDVGYTMQAGGTMLLHGQNPYVDPLPPWNAPISLAAGPLTFVFTAPMSFFPVIMAAHLSTLVFAFLLGWGLYKLVELIYPENGLVATAFYFSLPIMTYEVMAVPIIHFMTAACIVWSLYFYISGKKITATLVALIGTGVMLIPAALMVPYLFHTKGRKRLQMFSVFIGPLALTAYLARGIFNVWSISGYLSLSGLIGFYYGFLLSPGLANILRWIPAAVLLCWFLYSSYRSGSEYQVLRISAGFFLLLPFMFGNFGAFYYIWEYVLVIPAFLTYAGTG